MVMLQRNMTMLERYELFGPSQDRFGNPAPLGLLGLAIACAALVPIALGSSLTAGAFASAAAYALLFGGGCQMLCGLMMFANKNSFGGTVFTCFSFLWAMNGYGFWSLSQGRVPDLTISLAVEIVLFVIFVALTWGFGHIARMLFLFLLDIDLLFVFRIVRSIGHITNPGHHAGWLDKGVLVTTLGLGAIGLWLAFGGLLNPIIGRPVFGVGGPIFHAPKPKAFDWTVRRALFSTLYDQWKEAAFRPLPMADLRKLMNVEGVESPLEPDLFYLAELGFVVLVTGEDDPHRIDAARLHAKGVDIHEQLVLGKYNPLPTAH